MATLTNLSVSFISLVRSPATGKALTLKTAAGQRAEMIRIAKTDDERMMAFGIVYAPDQPDSHGDTADAATIRRAAYEFMREGRSKSVDREHSFTPEMAYVAESWIIRAADPLFPDEPEGAWAVGIQIGDPDLWKQLKSGELTGISLAGIAQATPAAPNAQWTEKEAGSFMIWLKGLFHATQPTTVEDTMNKTEVEEAVRGVLKAELPAIVQEVLKSQAARSAAPATPTATPAPAAAPAAAPASVTVETAKADEVATLKAAVSALEDKFAIAMAKGLTELSRAAAPAGESFL